jgi:hypothetical protein
MRKYFMTAFILAAMFAFATSGLALEKTAVRANPGDVAGWDAAASCSVAYYNTCNGWLWRWTNWSPGDKFGVVWQPCCPGGQLTTTQTRFASGSPVGYGFTGTLLVESVVANCPGALLASQPLLAAGGVGSNQTQNWVGIPAGPVVFSFQLSQVTGDTVAPLTDHPAAGPTGAAACGNCYPTTRVANSFYWGNATTALCPGSTFFDGLCDSESA